jgi:hypothetical protein
VEHFDPAFGRQAAREYFGQADVSRDAPRPAGTDQARQAANDRSVSARERGNDEVAKHLRVLR